MPAATATGPAIAARLLTALASEMAATALGAVMVREKSLDDDHHQGSRCPHHNGRDPNGESAQRQAHQTGRHAEPGRAEPQ